MKKDVRHLWLAPAVVAVYSIMLSTGSCTAAEGQKLFDVDVNKQKAGLEKDFTQAEEFLNQTKLQNARGQAELLEHKVKQMKPDLSKEEAASYQAKIDNVTTRIGAKEDSLIKVTMDILHTKGVDPALAYLQNDLRLFGVSEKKTSAAEKTILEEAPKIQQSLERQAVERAVKALQNGQALEPDMDPYIVKTAERIIKAHADSITAVENARARKELEEKQRQERLQKEKEDKEKKLEEDRAAKLKQEEDKKKLAEQEIERKKQEAGEKEKQRLARIEEERQKKLAAEAEKARKDSLAVAQKDSIASAQKLSAQLAQQAKAEKERQSKLTAQQKEQERAAREGRAEEDRKKQELAQQEKARKDSLAAAQKDSIAAAQKIAEQQAKQEKERQGKLTAQQKEQERLARVDQERQQKLAAQAAAQAERARKDSLATAQKDSIAAARKAEKAQPAQPVVQKRQPPKQQVPEAQPQQPEQEKPPVISENAKVYLQGLRDYRKKAQEKVMALYDLVEKNRTKEALDKFKQDRSFIAQYVDAQVFNVLEQTIAQSAAATQPEVASAPPTKPEAVSPQQEEIDKINSFLQHNQIESAYAEFKRTQSSLRHFMKKEEFKQLKDEVESAYKIRKQGGR